MNYGELIAEIRDLGFGDDSEMDEFDEVVPNAINRAITEINTTVDPIVKKYEFTQDGTETDLLYYDMTELTKEDGRECFLDFGDTPVMVGDTIYKKFNNFEIENENTLVIDGSIKGNFRVFYKYAHLPFTIESDDNTEIPLPLKVHNLVPLLASYYIWLEDEQTKAVMYFNRYEQLMQNVLAKKYRARVRIMEGGI